jgi:HEPN domain-containing protein
MRPETEAWVEDAEYDLQSAKAMLDCGRYFFVVFMCHLTIEKLLKSIIVERQGLEPPRIHNLIGLIALLHALLHAPGGRCLPNVAPSSTNWTT